MVAYRKKREYESNKFDLVIGRDDYVADFCARAELYHRDGCLHMRNGDIGYPEENEVEITDFKMNRLIGYDEEGNEIEVADKKILDDAEYEICNWLVRNVDVFDEVA